VRTGAGTLWKDVRRWLPGVVISAIAIVLVARLASWSELRDAFRQVRIANLGVAFALTILSLATRAMAWRELLDRKPSFARAFWGISEGYFLNNIFPLRAGEVGRAVFVGRAINLSPFHVLSTIVIERAFDLAMAAALLLLTLPLAFGQAWLKPIALITLAIVLGVLVALFLAARNQKMVKAWLGTIGQRWAFFDKQVLPRLGSLLEGLNALTKPSQFIFSLLWIVVTWIIWIALYYIMLLTIAPHAPLWWGAFADAVLALGVAIPSAPSGLGVYEGALVWALSLFGIASSSALAYAILMHFVSFVTTGVFGLIGLIQEKRSVSALMEEIQIGSGTPES
jgi:glycosyltransferase 2 family protein